jgi:hypothetical protein
MSLAPSSTRATTSTRQSLQWLLVGTQIALSVTLLAGAGLLIRSIDAMSRTDAGFDAERVLTLRVSGRRNPQLRGEPRRGMRPGTGPAVHAQLVDDALWRDADRSFDADRRHRARGGSRRSCGAIIPATRATFISPMRALREE